MKVMVVGAGGQLGSALARAAPSDVQLLVRDSRALDITDERAVSIAIANERPDVLFNAAAYTAVDLAESEERVARRINADAVGFLADAARAAGTRFVHISTDFVFDGRSGQPYRADSPPNPLGAYGRTKLAGEGRAGGDALIVRTAWLYAPRGKNFVQTMLHIMATNPEIRVVDDQIGTPTQVDGLAKALWSLALQGARGIYHYSDSGAASWYDFAVAIQEEGLALGLLDRAAPIVPIGTADYPTPAIRPSYSVLDKSDTWRLLGGAAPHWRVSLRTMLSETTRHG